jgi:nitrite reductase/ring-hydroxylating ferredoxin subunit
MGKDDFVYACKTQEVAEGCTKHVAVRGKEICGFHGAQFDITNGKKITQANLPPPQGMDPLLESWQRFLDHSYNFMSHIKINDQAIRSKVEEGSVKLRIS